MIVKALCLAINSISYALSFQPPPSFKVNTKTDKITDEAQMRKLTGHHVVSTATVAVHKLQTATYIYLMTTASKTSSLLAVQQFAVLGKWHFVAVVLSIAGCALRKWSFATLDQFFTVRMFVN